jgi:hypothetical protein
MHNLNAIVGEDLTDQDKKSNEEEHQQHEQNLQNGFAI